MLTPEFNFFHCRWSVQIWDVCGIGKFIEPDWKGWLTSKEYGTTRDFAPSRRYMELESWKKHFDFCVFCGMFDCLGVFTLTFWHPGVPEVSRICMDLWHAFDCCDMSWDMAWPSWPLMDVAELMELAADGLPVVSAARAAGSETRSEQRPERQKEPLVEQGPEERPLTELSEASEALAKSMWRPLKSESCGEQISVVSFNMLLKGEAVVVRGVSCDSSYYFWLLSTYTYRLRLRYQDLWRLWDWTDFAGFDQKPYYPELPSTLRAWEWRKPQLVNLIYGMDADVYCNSPEALRWATQGWRSWGGS